MSLKFKMEANDLKSLIHEVENSMESMKNGWKVQVGILKPKPYPDRPEVNVAEVATWHEYGTKWYVPRPFFSKSQMAMERSRNVKEIIKDLTKQQNKKGTLGMPLFNREGGHLIGSEYVGVIMRTINKSSLYASLMPETIKNKERNRKRSMKVLKYMTFLYNSIDYRIISPGGHAVRSRSSTMYIRANAVGTSHLEMQYGDGG